MKVIERTKTHVIVENRLGKPVKLPKVAYAALRKREAQISTEESLGASFNVFLGIMLIGVAAAVLMWLPIEEWWMLGIAAALFKASS